MLLLECLCKKSIMDSYKFLELNEKPMRDEEFDDVCELRKHLGSLIRALSKCCGTLPVLNLLDARMAASYSAFSQAPVGMYTQILAEIEGSLFVVSELAKTVSSEELVYFLNVIELIEKLP